MKDTRFKKGHKTTIVKEKVCAMCGVIFKPKTNRQSFCGGHANKSGCGWKHSIKKRNQNNKALIKKKIANDPDFLRRIHLKQKYNLTLEQYFILSMEQENVCAICKSKETGYQTNYMYVDHDHATGKVRGLLCNKCNFGLGNFKDKINILESAINYLKKERI